MGVHGLWKLLESTGKPINPETLEGKILAVDISIWLNQAVKGVRDRDGNAVQNAHLLTLFNRLCKLLFFRIRPVFVYDGDAPLLKKQTLAVRRQRREETNRESRQTSEKLLQTFLKRQAIRAALGENSQESAPSLSSVRRDEHDDIYVLPALPPEDDRQESSSEEEKDGDEALHNYSRFQEELCDNPDAVDINSEQFSLMPPEIKHEILKEMKEFSKRRRTLLHKPPERSGEFSQYQLAGLLQRNRLNQRLECVEQEMNQRSSGGHTDQQNTEIRRLVSEDSSHYILIKGGQKKVSAAATPAAPALWSSSPWEPKGRNKGKPEPLWRPVSEEEENKPSSSSSSSPEDQSAGAPASPRTLQAIQSAMMESEDEDQQIQDSRSKTNIIPSSSKNEEQQIQNSRTRTHVITSSSSEDEDQQIQNSRARTHIITSSSEDETEIRRTSDPAPGTTDLKLESRTPLSLASAASGSLEQTHTLQQDAKSSEDESRSSVILDCVRSETQRKTREEEEKEEESTVNQILQFRDSRDPSEKEEREDQLEENREKREEEEESSADESFVEVSDAEEPPETDESHINTHQTDYNTEEKEEEEEEEESSAQSTDQIEDVDESVNEASAVSEWEHIDTEELQQLDRELQDEQQTLREQHQQQQRSSSTVTGQMCQESQELLRLFGVPFIVAPMEAEAQCAALDRLDQTHGTITDDSDIWLFGGRHVYRNFFNQNKYVEHYQIVDMQNQLGLDRSKLINLAYLLGSDYTEGIPGVGYVTGMEILNEFPGAGLEPLVQLSEWWTEAQENKKLSVNPKDTKVKKKLRNLQIHPGFPNPAVAQAYLQPSVDQSDASFSWGRPHLDLIKEFCQSRFGWSSRKTEETLQPVLKQLQSQQTQLRIDSFFRLEQQERQQIRSERLRRAVICMKRKEREEEEEEESVSPQKQGRSEADEAPGPLAGGFISSDPQTNTQGGGAKQIRAESSSSSSEEEAESGKGVAMVTARSVFEGKTRGRGKKPLRGRGRSKNR